MPPDAPAMSVCLSDLSVCLLAPAAPASAVSPASPDAPRGPCCAGPPPRAAGTAPAVAGSADAAAPGTSSASTPDAALTRSSSSDVTRLKSVAGNGLTDRQIKLCGRHPAEVRLRERPDRQTEARVASSRKQQGPRGAALGPKRRCPSSEIPTPTP
jgi:hypothetical protein